MKRQEAAEPFCAHGHAVMRRDGLLEPHEILTPLRRERVTHLRAKGGNEPLGFEGPNDGEMKRRSLDPVVPGPYVEMLISEPRPVLER